MRTPERTQRHAETVMLAALRERAPWTPQTGTPRTTRTSTPTPRGSLARRVAATRTAFTAVADRA